MKEIIISILKLSTVLLFFTFISAGCQKDDDEWLQIEPINPNAQITEHLDSIFSMNNNCLLNFEDDTLIHTIFNYIDFKEIDSCHDLSEIDFDNYTLIVGKIKVASISDQISSIVLTTNNRNYKMEASIDKCVECYWAIGYIYFWRLYPKLQSNIEIKLSVN